jgi:hypothetical protein
MGVLGFHIDVCRFRTSCFKGATRACKLPPDNAEHESAKEEGASKGVTGFRLDDTTIGETAKTEGRACN